MPRSSTFQRLALQSVAGAIFVVCFLGCHTGPSHPPTFADFQRANRLLSESGKFDATLAVFEAARLTDEQKLAIVDRGATDQLIGAGTLEPIASPLARELLIRAAELSPNEPVAWAAVAYRDLSLLYNHVGNASNIDQELANAIEKLRTCDSSNSLPIYLKAAEQCIFTNMSSVKLLLAEATQLQAFDTYERAIQQSIIRTGESNGWSAYTARAVATGHSEGFSPCFNLSKTVMEQLPTDREAVRNCIVLGARASKSASMMDQLIGDTIQSRAMDKLSGEDFSIARARIAEDRARIKRATRYLDSPKTADIPEARWIQYFDQTFTIGEMTAIETLAAERGDTL